MFQYVKFGAISFFSSDVNYIVRNSCKIEQKVLDNSYSGKGFRVTTSDVPLFGVLVGAPLCLDVSVLARPYLRIVYLLV